MPGFRGFAKVIESMPRKQAIAMSIVGAFAASGVVSALVRTIQSKEL